MSDPSVKLMRGSALAAADQAVATIDDLLAELEEHPEHFTPEVLAELERINLKNRFRTIRTEFKQIEEDIQRAPNK